MPNQDDWIKWQMSQTGNPDEIMLCPPEDMSVKDVERICALYVIITLAVLASLIGIALIVACVCYITGVW